MPEIMAVRLKTVGNFREISIKMLMLIDDVQNLCCTCSEHIQRYSNRCAHWCECLRSIFWINSKPKFWTFQVMTSPAKSIFARNWITLFVRVIIISIILEMNMPIARWRSWFSTSVLETNFWKFSANFLMNLSGLLRSTDNTTGSRTTTDPSNKEISMHHVDIVPQSV